MKIKDYIKKVKRKPDTLHKMLAQLEKMKKFNVGDIINIKDREGVSYKYMYEDIVSDVNIKFKVVYVDILGYPHIQELLQDNKPSNIIPMLSYFEEDISEVYYNDVKVDDVFIYDEDFLNGLVLSIPIEDSLKDRFKDEDDRMMHLALEWHRIHNYNKSLKLNASKIKKLKKWRNNLE